jgi:antitoxin component of MazEF toxin-antitoxin module
MIRKLRRSGSALSVTIPSLVASEARLSAGTPVRVRAEGGRIVIQRAGEAEPDLDDMLRRITKKNRHSEAEFGRAVGREAW